MTGESGNLTAVQVYSVINKIHSISSYSDAEDDDEAQQNDDDEDDEGREVMRFCMFLSIIITILIAYIY